MFQYAAARGVASRGGAELVVDSWSGFVRDRQYRRHFELDAFPIRARLASEVEKAPFWIERVAKRFLGERHPENWRKARFYGDLLVEPVRKFMPELTALIQTRSCWMDGYWQAPDYFEHCAEDVRRELAPPTPSDSRFLALGERMQRSNSVALGVRLYEESETPEVHARGGRMKNVGEINAAIMRLYASVPDAHFYVFCTHRSPLLEELVFPGSFTWLTHDDGYEGTMERFWLLTKCRHHLFTNSSYYWWGAWISSRMNIEKGCVIAADNFLNEDSIPSYWQTF